MTARVAKEEMALLLPNSLSNYAAFAPGEAEAFRPQNGFVQKLADALRWMVELPRRRAVMDELNTLSDHELSDIGLTRSELSRVFDPTFIAQREKRRDVHGRRSSVYG